MDLQRNSAENSEEFLLYVVRDQRKEEREEIK
jgi:hypothetical protein